MNKRLGSLLVITLLSGCAAGPDYHAPDSASLAVPVSYAPPVTPATAGGPRRIPSVESPNLAAWWRQFNDPLLTELITQATAGNLQIAQSLARLAEAREARVQAGANLLPTVSASAQLGENYTRSPRTSIAAPTAITSGGSSTSNQLSLGADASWQADIFGGLARGLQASRAEEAGAYFDLEGVRTSVAGEVATNYINARLAQARLQIARSTLSTQDENLQIARWRVQAGLASSLDSEQARAQRAQTAAGIPLLESSYLQAVARLGTLTGQAPGALRAKMESPEPIPRGPDSIAIGIPADTLRRRPDVRSAERALAAATARIGVARAALFPALSISGNFSTTAQSVGSLGSILTGGLFATLAQTIFDAGKRNSQVRSARAGADLAFASYKQTVLSGLEDVENAAQALNAAEARQAQLAAALEASSNAAIYARSQYRSGLIDFLTLLQSEQTLLSARDQLASAQADQSLALVQLYLALGGGWQPAPVGPTGI